MSKIKINVVSEIVDVVKFTIAESPRNSDFTYTSGYFMLISDASPEFVDNCLYVLGSDSTGDRDVLEASTKDFAKLLVSIEEYNVQVCGCKSNIPDLISCCGHLYLNAKDCACKFHTCAICSKVNHEDDSKSINVMGDIVYICTEHIEDKVCLICGSTNYMLHPHAQHGTNVQVCERCINSNVQFGHQHNYSYKPSPLFHDIVKGRIKKYSLDAFRDDVDKINRKFWMGHEVEQQFPQGANRGMLIGDMESKQGKLIYCKSDSSIGNGTECVTHPFSWEFYKKRNWDGILNKQVKDWRSSGCSVGHHVHINRGAFTRLHMYRFIKFMATNRAYVEFISQRSMENYCKFSGDSLAKTKNKRSSDHCDFINMTPNTIEWRAFASPINLLEFKKNVEFIYAAYLFTKDLCNKELKSSLFESYVITNTEEYPNLASYIHNKSSDNASRFTPNEEYSGNSPSNIRADVCFICNKGVVNTTQIINHELDTHVYICEEHMKNIPICSHCGAPFIGVQKFDEDGELVCELCHVDLQSSSDVHEVRTCEYDDEIEYDEDCDD
jgi:hypothetical protein